jgi:palmitoyl-protein thioesterase
MGGALLRASALLLLCAAALTSSPLPVVLWHGMGDAAASAGMRAVAARLALDLPGVHVHSVCVGAPEEDMRAGFFGRVDAQVASVCAALLADPLLAGPQGFNAIGFSQGGLFLRALAQRCGVRVRTLVTMGSPHAGVAAVPGCAPGSGALCEEMQALLAQGAYRSFIQSRVVQAQYYRAPTDEEAFLRGSLLLPDANNLRASKNATYAAQIRALERLVLFRFSDDATVVPRDSAWFSSLAGDTLTPLREQELYTADWLGLRALDEARCRV